MSKIEIAPVLYAGPYDLAKIKSLVDGKTTVDGAGNKGIREGVVIRPLHERHTVGLGRTLLKIVSNVFLEKQR